jgi:hypothetical protein
MTKIVEFRANNTRVLKCVRIVPDPNSNVVVIGGDNGSGKTTVLDDIDLIFSGTKKAPALPIRVGQTEADTSVKLSNGLEITREWSASGTRVIIRDADGKKLPGGPQGILDKMFSAVAFDPLEFADKMDGKAQAEVLRQLVGLDFSTLDARRETLYSDREESGRDLKRSEGQLAGMAPASDDTPDAEVSVSSLVAEKDAAERTNRDHAKVFDGLERARRLREGNEEELEGAKRALATAQAAYDGAVADEDAADAATRALAPDIDVSPIVAKLNTAEATNRAVRSKRERTLKLAEVEKLRAYRANLTAEIEEVDAEKGRQLAAIKWPVDGLGFGGDGVTLDGIPFAQASKAERYKVSVAIGAASNPELHVMLARDASLLDAKSVALLSTLAEERDLQLWMERVGDKDPGAIVLEDGEVKAASEEKAPALSPKRRVKVMKDGKEIA